MIAYSSTTDTRTNHTHISLPFKIIFRKKYYEETTESTSTCYVDDYLSDFAITNTFSDKDFPIFLTPKRDLKYFYLWKETRMNEEHKQKLLLKTTKPIFPAPEKLIRKQPLSLSGWVASVGKQKRKGKK
jgi:hypothetical protein